MYFQWLHVQIQKGESFLSSNPKALSSLTNTVNIYDTAGPPPDTIGAGGVSCRDSVIPGAAFGFSEERFSNASLSCLTISTPGSTTTAGSRKVGGGGGCKKQRPSCLYITENQWHFGTIVAAASWSGGSNRSKSVEKVFKIYNGSKGDITIAVKIMKQSPTSANIVYLPRVSQVTVKSGCRLQYPIRIPQPPLSIFSYESKSSVKVHATLMISDVNAPMENLQPLFFEVFGEVVMPSPPP